MSAKKKFNPGKFLVIGAMVLVALLVVMSSDIFVSIKYGQVGVKTRFGALTGEALQPGLHVKLPFVEKVVQYRTQKIIYEASDNPQTSQANYTDYPVNTTTKDGQTVDIRYTVRFYIDDDKIKDVAKKLGTEAELVEKIIKADSRIQVRNTAREFLAENLYSGDIEQVEERIIEKLNESFSDNGIILDEFGIRGISFSQEYQQTIESKQLEKERIQIEEYKAEQEKYKKKQKITAAEAEAEAQRLQQQTLTKAVLQKLYLEKWDGKLPEVMTGGESLIFDLNR